MADDLDRELACLFGRGGAELSESARSELDKVRRITRSRLDAHARAIADPDYGAWLRLAARLLYTELMVSPCALAVTRREGGDPRVAVGILLAELARFHDAPEGDALEGKG